MKLMVSFCNAALSCSALGQYDVERDRFRWVDMGASDHVAVSATGLCFGDDRFWCVFPGARDTQLLTFDRRFALMRVDELVGIGDAHSVARLEDRLLINNSANNALTEVRWQGERIEQRTVWQGPGSQTDRIHLNSVTVYRGEVIISMIGPKPADGWWHARDGQILNITTGEVICQDLAHPHSLIVFDDVLYWIESRAKKIHAFSPGRGHRVVADLAELPGYPRGLVVDEHSFYVGASAQRRKSKSTGLDLPLGERTDVEACSWLYRIDRMSGKVDRRNFAALPEEVYDLERVPPGFEMSDADDADPAIERIWWLVDELRYAQSNVEAARAETSRVAGQIGRDLERTARWARELEAECVRREAWARELEAALAQSGDRASQLEAALSEATRWAHDLEAECVRRGTWARELEVALQETTAWARQLEAECKRRGAVIEELQGAAESG